VAGLLVALHRIRHANAWLFGTMLFSSVLSLIASFVLSVDAVRLAADPTADLSCNINAVISCGTSPAHGRRRCSGFPTRSSG
jgi:hypothetical protein